MMRARVKADYRWNRVSCAQLEFVKSEWRPLPAQAEQEARTYEMLELSSEPSHSAAPFGKGAGGPPPPAPNSNATDAAIKLAADHGLDLSEIDGSGADGRILVSDVKAAIGEQNG